MIRAVLDTNSETLPICGYGAAGTARQSEPSEASSDWLHSLINIDPEL